MLNVFKVVTPEEARAYSYASRARMSPAKLKELSDSILRVAKTGAYECLVADLPLSYKAYLEELGFEISYITDGLVRINWD